MGQVLILAKEKWKGYHVITQASVAMKFTVSHMLQGESWIKDAGMECPSYLDFQTSGILSV